MYSAPARNTMISSCRGSLRLPRAILSPCRQRELSSTSVDLAQPGEDRSYKLMTWVREFIGRMDDKIYDARDAIVDRGPQAATTVFNHPEITVRGKHQPNKRPGPSHKVNVVDQALTAARFDGPRQRRLPRSADETSAPFRKILPTTLSNVSLPNQRSRTSSPAEYVAQFYRQHSREYYDSYYRATGDSNDFLVYDSKFAEYRMESVESSKDSVFVMPTRHPKPPITEPNMAKNQNKKDRAKRKEREKKKPIIRLSNDSETCVDKYCSVDDSMTNTVQQTPLCKSDSKKVKNVSHLPHKQLTVPTSNISEESESRKQWSSMMNFSPINKESSKLMKSAGDKTTVDAVIALSKPTTGLFTASTKKPKTTTDTTKTKKTSFGMTKVPSGKDSDNSTTRTFEEELSAWKEAATKSKVPKDSATIARDEFLAADIGPDLVSIRPEPPQPKLDIRVVPSPDQSKTSKISKSKETISANIDAEKTGSLINSTLSKKLHTSCYHRLLKSSNSMPNTRRLTSSSRKSETDHSQGVSSTDVRKKSKSEKITSGTHIDNIDIDADFAEKLSTVVDKEASTSVRFPSASGSNHSNTPSSRIHKGSKETESHQYYKTFDENVPRYGSTNESAHEATTSARTSPEEVQTNFRKEEEVSTKESQMTEIKSVKAPEEKKKEMKQEKKESDSDTFIIDGDYVRLPGDPYPYSRELFFKWRLPMGKQDSDNILRHLPKLNDEQTVVTSIGKSTGSGKPPLIPGRRSAPSGDRQASLREMSTNAVSKSNAFERIDDFYTRNSSWTKKRSQRFYEPSTLKELRMAEADYTRAKVTEKFFEMRMTGDAWVDRLPRGATGCSSSSKSTLTRPRSEVRRERQTNGYTLWGSRGSTHRHAAI